MAEELRFIPSYLVGEVGKDSQEFSRPLLDEDHRLIVSIDASADGSLTVFGKALSVAANIETKVMEYLVPENASLLLYGASANGMTDAVFKLYVDEIQFCQLNNNWCNRNVDFRCIMKVMTGKKIKITATHGSLIPHDFAAWLYGKTY